MTGEIRLTVVAPTRNERDNVGPLVQAVRAALDGIDWELLVVDDSDDGTDRAVAEIAAADARVRLLHRAVNHAGLAGAVQDGFAAARGEFTCVIDGDLQHPPATIRLLLAEAERTGADIVIASRYIPGGSTGGLDGPLRQIYSRALRLLTMVAFPRRLRGITDPLGGFFLVRRSVVQSARLRPVGYKILLEVLVRCRWQRPAEVPYRFAPRHAGETKANMRQGLWFLQHLARLVWECSPAMAPVRRVLRPGC